MEKVAETTSCGSPGCGRPIEGPADQKFLIVRTGQVISLKRCADCVTKYEGVELRRVEDADLKLLLSPASVRRNVLQSRRRARPLGVNVGNGEASSTVGSI